MTSKSVWPVAAAAGLFVFTLSFTTVSFSQTAANQGTGAPQAVPADPLSPTAAVPPLTHRSAFDGYRPLGDTQPGSWRQANDTVRAIGGWQAYAREAQGLPPQKPPVTGGAAVPAATAPTTTAHGTGVHSHSASGAATPNAPPSGATASPQSAPQRGMHGGGHGGMHGNTHGGTRSPAAPSQPAQGARP